MRPIRVGAKPPLNQTLPSPASVMLPPSSEPPAGNSAIVGGLGAGGGTGVGAGAGAGGGGGGAGGGGGGTEGGGAGAAIGLPVRIEVSPVPPPHALKVAAKAAASRRILKSFIGAPP
jgi:hypothetical protein